MPVKTYRLGVGNDGNYAALFEADQTAANRTDGWTVGKIAAGNSAHFDVGVKQATTALTSQTTTPKPGTALLTGASANAFKTPAALSGVFASGGWAFTLVVRAMSVASSQNCFMRLRVFKSVNADGTAAVELTTALQTTTDSFALLTTTDAPMTVTWNPGAAITLNNEYLFFAVALEVRAAGGSNTADVCFRTGQSAAGTRIVTPNFVVPVNTPITLAATSVFTPELADIVKFGKAIAASPVLTPAMTAVQPPKFPVQAVVVDDFNRANQILPGSKWQAFRYSDAVMLDSPRAYFHGDDPPVTPGFGANVMYDWSGNGNNLSPTGSPNFQLPGINPNRLGGYSLSAQSPDGGGWYVGLPTWTQTLGDVFTIELWLQRNSLTDTNFQIIVDKYNGGFALRLYPDGSIQAGIPQGYGMSVICTSSVGITDLRPHHVVYTKNGAASRIYIDGVNVTGTVANQTVDWNTGYWMYFFCGAYGPGSNFRFSDFAIYPTALTYNRIRSHFRGSGYEREVFNLTAPFGYWPLGEKSGTTVNSVDQEGGANRLGTYNGAVRLNQPGAIVNDRNGSVELGAGGYVSINADANLNASLHFHIHAWVYPTASVADDVMIYGHANPTGTTKQPAVLGYGPKSGSGQRVWAGFYDGTVWKTVADVADLPLNEWTFLGAAFNNTSGLLELYRNGNVVASGTLTGKLAIAAATVIYIGRHWSNTTTFPGRIADVAYWPGNYGAGLPAGVHGRGRAGPQVVNNKLTVRAATNYAMGTYGDTVYWMPTGDPYFTHDAGAQTDQNAIGYNATYFRQCQAFIAKGPILQSVRAEFYRIGAQTDPIIVELCTDDAGRAGRVIGQIASQLPGAGTNVYTWNCDLPTSVGQTYWISFRRTGPADAANYVNLMHGDPNADFPVFYYQSEAGVWNQWYRTIKLLLTSGSFVPGVDQEAFATISTEAFAGGSLFLRVRASPWNDSYYYAQFQQASSGNDYAYIYKRVNGVSSGLGAVDNTRVFAVGDTVGIGIKGSKITIYHKPSGGSWVEVMNRTDTSITAPGFAAISAIDPVLAVDDFGFGSTKTYLMALAAVANFTGSVSWLYQRTRFFAARMVFAGQPVYSSRIMSLGPVAYWRLGEASGTVAVDAAGNLNGTYTGTPTLAVPGAIADGTTAVNFTNGYISVPASLAHSSLPNFTAEAWVYPTAGVAVNTDDVAILSSVYATTPIPLTLAYGSANPITTSTQRLWGGYYTGSGWARVVDPTDLPLNQWTHCAITYDGTTLRLYRNGVEVANAASGGWNPSTQAFYVGRRWDNSGTTYNFPGRMDEAAIYSRALSAADIMDNYNSAPATVPTYYSRIRSLGPKAYWRLGASPLVDDSGNGNTLTNPAGTPPAAASLLTSDSLNGSIDFQGGYSYLQSPHTASISPPPPRTFEAWVNLDAIGSYQTILWKGSTNEYIFRIVGAQVWYAYHDGTNLNQYASGNVLSAGTTYHIAVVDDGVSTIRIYVNGVQVDFFTRAGSVTVAGSGILNIGSSSPASPSDSLDGRIDEIAIYGYALSAADVLANYQTGKGTYAGIKMMTSQRPAPQKYLDAVTTLVPALSKKLNDFTSLAVTSPMTAALVKKLSALRTISAATTITPALVKTKPPALRTLAANLIFGGATQTYPDVVLSDTPALYWRFDEISGTVAADSSGNGRPGTYFNAPTLNQSPLITTDKSVFFDNVSDFCLLSSGFLNTVQATVEIWFDYDGVAAASNNFICGFNEGDNSPTGDKQIRLGTDVPRFYAWGPGAYAAVAASPISAGVHHLVGTYDGTNLKIYVDGVEAGSAACPGTYTGATTPNILVGGVSSAENFSARKAGRRDEFAVYTYALSPARILAHYQAGISAGLAAPGMSRVAKFPRAVAATPVLTPVMSRRVFGARTFAVTSALVPIISDVVKRYRTAAATTVITPALSRAGLVFPRTIAATMTITAALVKANPYQRAISAVTTLTPALTKKLSAVRAVAATVTFTPALTKQLFAFRTAAVTTVITPAMTRLALRARTFAATATLTPALSKIFKAPRVFAINLQFIANMIKQAAGELTYSQKVIADGVSFYWRLGESAGTTAVEAKNGLNATHIGGVIVGQAGALTLSGDNDLSALYNVGTAHTDAPADSRHQSLSNWTIEAWIYAESLPGDDTAIASHGYMPGNIPCALVYAASGQIYAGFYSGGWQIAIETLTLPLNIWHHVVGTYDGTNVRVYRNGSLVQIQARSGWAAAPANAIFRIGGRWDANINFPGRIDEVALYPTALSSAKVLEHFRTGGGVPNTPLLLSASAIFTPVISRTRGYARAVAATPVLTPALARVLKLSKPVNATVTLTPALARKLASLRTLAATTVITPSLSRLSKGYRAVAAGLNLLPALSRRLSAYRTFGASTTLTPTMTPRIAAGRLLAASTTILATMTNAAGKARSFAGSITLTPAITYLSGKGRVLNATVSLVAGLKKLVGKRIDATLNFIPKIQRKSTMTLAGQVTLEPALSLRSRVGRVFDMVITLSAQLGRSTRKGISLAAQVPIAANMLVGRVTKITLSAVANFTALFDYVFGRAQEPTDTLLSSEVAPAQLLAVENPDEFEVSKR